MLPSANLKLDLTHDLIARFAAAETMTRPDYSALGGFTNLTPPGNAGWDRQRLGQQSGPEAGQVAGT